MQLVFERVHVYTHWGSYTLVNLDHSVYKYVVHFLFCFAGMPQARVQVVFMVKPGHIPEDLSLVWASFDGKTKAAWELITYIHHKRSCILSAWQCACPRYPSAALCCMGCFPVSWLLPAVMEFSLFCFCVERLHRLCCTDIPLHNPSHSVQRLRYFQICHFAQQGP